MAHLLLSWLIRLIISFPIREICALTRIDRGTTRYGPVAHHLNHEPQTLQLQLPHGTARNSLIPTP
jgi:hypothetical protein